MQEKLSRRRLIETAAVGLAATSLPLAATAVRAAPGTGTLYARLGGYDAIAAVVDDFIGRMAKDPALAKFFIGHSTHSLQRIRQLVIEQICAGTGGPCVYTGRDMKTSHRGMGIANADWDKAAAHLVGTLDKFKVPAKEKQELLAIVATLKPDIVEKP
jgi:hemoglobin